MPAPMQADRDGGGVGWAQFRPDMSEGQEFGDRPTFINALAEWFGTIPDVHARLSSGARMADVGSGGGWTSISLAKAYPALTVDGFDLDAPAVERARANAEAEGVADRVRFHAMSPADAEHGAGYDLVTAFECIHDMPRRSPSSVRCGRWPRATAP
jgi:2-polyprenyl-3-methyl-5-hydroxy-6-metoxy-1,4-benzoquinol methylase